ncbi:MAG: DNA pilot protein [Microviridae sp.]|nr:MAG: DNA pilot protein [Microviridae sp.]
MFPMIGGLLGGLASGAMNLIGQEETNKMNMQMQQQQMAYNTQMSNTAYQRASADMKAAGLNPMMMFGSGQAASAPTAPPVQLKSGLQAAGPAIDTAISSAVSLKTMDKMAEEIANLKVTKDKIIAETASEAKLPALREQQTLLTADTASKTVAETQLRKAALPVALNEALTAKNLMDMDPRARRILEQAGYGGRKASDVISPVANLVSSARQGMNMFGHGY